jgi:hypothetical protein
MDKIGYLLSEAPIFIFVLWFSIRLVQYRRYRNNRPIYTESDRRMLFHSATGRASSLMIHLKLALAIVAVTTVGYPQVLALAPLGAAILSCLLLLTSATIVHRLLLDEA